MFNAMGTDELLLALSDVLRTAGRLDRPLNGFERSQLMSASSIARNLAAEERGAAATIRTANEAIADAVADARDVHAGPVAPAVDGRELGATITVLLDHLRSDDRPSARRLRTRLQSVLRTVTDDEVASLAAGASR